MLIHIPFLPRWKAAMLDGRKTMTARTKQYGSVGDTFSAYGHTFELVDICPFMLSTIAKDWYQEEGCASPHEFQEVWEQIHPKKGFVPSQTVYLHRFKKQPSAAAVRE